MTEPAPWRSAALTLAIAPAGYVDLSWVEDTPHGATFRALRRAGACGRRLSRWVLDHFQLAWLDLSIFETPRTRLVLLDAASLQRVTLFVGLALRAEEMRGVLGGTARARITEEIGREGLDFAVRGSLLLGRAPRFGFEPDARRLRLRLVAIGAAFALSPSAWAVPGYADRLRLKLPKPVAGALPADWTQHPDLPPDPALPPLVRRIVREVAPQWSPLLA